MRRIAGLAVAGVVLAIVVVATGAASGSGGQDRKQGTTIRVVERAATDTSVDLGATGDSVGDVIAFGNELFDHRNRRKVGTDQGYCVRTVVGRSYECTWTNRLAKGQITVQGPFLDSGDSVLAITGGTGAYRNARGTMALHARSATTYRFTFHVRK